MNKSSVNVSWAQTTADQLDPNLESFKHSSHVNLVTDGSENIEDDTDECLNVSQPETKHKKKVSFVTEEVEEGKEEGIEKTEFEPTLRPQSTISHLSVAEEYVIRESRCSRIVAESRIR